MLTGLVAPLDNVNVDTDQIIPKQFLKLVQRIGFGKYLFNDWRVDKDGRMRTDFVLNNSAYEKAQILITRANFGCGSSREHAVWALQDYGFKVIIAPSFADIFYNNCFKNGILPIVLSDEQVSLLFRHAASSTSFSLTIDLAAQMITSEDLKFNFFIDSFRKKVLLEGLDDIALSLQHESRIRQYEGKRIDHMRIISLGQP